MKWLAVIALLLLPSSAFAGSVTINTSNDNSIYCAGPTWSGVHDGSNCSDTGGAVLRSGTSNYVQAYFAGDYLIERTGINFDCSTIPAGATVTAADVQVYSQPNGAMNITNYNIYGGSSFGNPIVVGDYNSNFGTTAWSATAYTSYVSGYHTFTMNSAGIAGVQACIGGTLKVAVLAGADASNSTPGGIDSQTAYSSSRGSSSQYAKLDVTYTTGGTVTPADWLSQFIPFGW